MTHNTDDLHVIGAALAAAGDGKPVELTDQQREVLARATFPDTLDAILAHVTIPPLDDSSADKIAAAWSDELRVAFRLQSTVDEIADDDSLQQIRNIVSRDDRLSTEEAQALLSALPDLGPHPTSRGSASTRLLIRQSPPRAYLASISVEGFRGIGPRAGLPLKPQRGLTLVYGANGSGKSTFVEALEVLLTGSTARFAGRGREWRSAWANAHRPYRGQIAAEFVVEDRDARRNTVQRDWAAADLAAATSEKDNSLWEAVQAIGGLDVAEAIDEFRPVLGYGELGPLFEESGPLEDAGSNVTQFAQHIRTRANIRDGITDTLWEFITNPSYRGGLYNELGAWFRIVRDVPDQTRLASVIGGSATDATLRSPANWRWATLATEYETVMNFSDEFTRSWLLRVARPYLPQLADQIRKSVVQMDSDGSSWLFGTTP